MPLAGAAATAALAAPAEAEARGAALTEGATAMPATSLMFFLLGAAHGALLSLMTVHIVLPDCTLP